MEVGPSLFQHCTLSPSPGGLKVVGRVAAPLPLSVAVLTAIPCLLCQAGPSDSFSGPSIFPASLLRRIKLVYCTCGVCLPWDIRSLQSPGSATRWVQIGLATPSPHHWITSCRVGLTLNLGADFRCAWSMVSPLSEAGNHTTVAACHVLHWKHC